MSRKKKSKVLLAPQAALPLGGVTDALSEKPPDFHKLLSDPMVEDQLPKNFVLAVEANHLMRLWNTSGQLRAYRFERFVYAGGSGLVFKAYANGEHEPLALKIAREHLYSQKATNPNLQKSLSPVSQQELRALRRLSHSNIVRLHDALEDEDKEKGVFAIATSFVDPPTPLDRFLLDTLRKDPDPKRRKGINPFAPERLDRACAFLVARFAEVVEAVAHMHEQQLFHCDLKPANILVNSTNHAIVTDLGSCIHPDDADSEGKIRVQFTWTYAHPKLTDLVSDVHGISGGGLKAWAHPKASEGLERFDLFAIGRTIQEMLAHLAREFGERCYAAYNFRFLHLIAALLLDGHNAPIKDQIRSTDERYFIKDAALEYPVDLFKKKKLTTAKQVSERLRRFSRSYGPHDQIPELDPWQPDVINTGIDSVAPFSHRVAEIFRHAAVRRLRSELQLGWVREVYPGATHTRWSHLLGVSAAAAEYYAALLADPEVPAARILLEPEDIEHGLVAAILHDLGQIAFGHDFEAAAPNLYDHEGIVTRLLDDSSWGHPTLRAVIERNWPQVKLERVLAILEYPKVDADKSHKAARRGKTDTADATRLHDPVDGLACDIVNGPIDADKLDYLIRDSSSCRVSYGQGIDRQRFLRALTVTAKEPSGRPRLALAYRAKGSAAVESLLLARYQMYGAVYWHHTFRCIQAMFGHAVAATFGNLEEPKIKLRNSTLERETLRDFFYLRVVCGHALSRCRDILKPRTLPAFCFSDPPVDIGGERALEFIWKFADDKNRELIRRLAGRDLFRRVFDFRTGDLGERADYTKIAAALGINKRVDLSETLTDGFLDSIYKKMQDKGPKESTSESEARKRHQELSEKRFPLVVFDYPTRGIPEEINFPSVIGDAARKYIVGRSGEIVAGQRVFHTVRQLQIAIASVRVFAAPELHELIVRYLNDDDVRDCVESVLPIVKVQQ